MLEQAAPRLAELRANLAVARDALVLAYGVFLISYSGLALANIVALIVRAPTSDKSDLLHP